MGKLREMTGARRVFELRPPLVLGRDASCDIQLQDPLASRRHAEIRRTPQGLVLLDLDSTHGTQLGGERIRERLLLPGDVLTLGATTLRYEADAAPIVEKVAVLEERPDSFVHRRVGVLDPAFAPEATISDARNLRSEYEKARAGLLLLQAIGSEVEPHRQMERIVETAREVLGADRAALLVADGAGELTTEIRNARAGVATELPLSRSIVQEVVEQRTGVLFSGGEQRFEKAVSIANAGVRSAMCVPVQNRGELFGVLHVDSQRRANLFTEADLDLLASMAGLAALSIRNAKLRQHAEDVVRAERERLSRIIRDLPDGVLVLDEAGVPALANPRGEAALAALSRANEAAPILALGGVALETLVARDGVGEDLRPADAAQPIFSVSAVRSGVTAAETVVVLRDVTQEREREGRLARQERLALVGTLAGGVAHDFNNLLSVIVSFTDAALHEIEAPAVRDDLEQVRAASRSASAIVRQLLTFSRREVREVRPVDLNLLTTELEKILRRTLPSDVELELDLEEGLCRTVADPAQLEQVLMNLVVNARDAMAEGGRISIRTRNTDVTAHAELPAGRYVTLSVADTGCGMTAEVVRRIFDPFFTTKERGKGTGLGLSTVHGIVQGSNGALAVASTPGQGTTFEILLPAQAAQA